MEITSPYLDAIQALPGETPTEKYKAINVIVKRLADRVLSEGDSLQNIEMQDVPDVLMPVIKIEVGILLKQYETVVTAFKSDDTIILNRAFKARWFFKGTNKDIINVQYFMKNLLPYVSLRTRSRLIKNLAMNLEQERTKVAEEFFTELLKAYGVDQVTPLLAACSESFILSTVINRRLVLSQGLLTILFRKYPLFVTRYLLFSKPEEPGIRNIYNMDIRQYSKLLPDLAKTYYVTLMQLVEAHPNLSIKLCRKGAEIYLTKCTENILNNPERHLPILPLKLVTARLSYDQFRTMLRNLYPASQDDFCFNEILPYLKYYPQDKKLDLIKASFYDKYGAHLADYPDKMCPEYLQLMPSEERFLKAKSLLAKDNDWHYFKEEQSWRCYLPTSSSIPMIIDEIGKTAAKDNRAALLVQLIYTCKINEDLDGLLKVLQYFKSKHTNEDSWVRFTFLDHLLIHFDLSLLSTEHWNILREFILTTYLRNELLYRVTVMDKLLTAAIRYNFISNMPVDRYIDFIVKVKLNSWRGTWNMSDNCLTHERTCLEKFLQIIPENYPYEDAIWEDSGTESIQKLLNVMYEFNERNMKALHYRLDNFSIKNYPWLMKLIERGITSERYKNSIQIKRTKALLKKYEKDLYDAWVGIGREICDIVTGHALELLKKNPQRIMDHWMDYLTLALKDVDNHYTIKFIRASRWYKELPMKFAKECLKEVKANMNTAALIILSLLFDGVSISNIFEPLAQSTSLQVDIHDKNTFTDSEQSFLAYQMIHALPNCVKVTNPPVSFSLVAKFCNPEFMHMALRCMTILSRRVQVSNVITHVTSLINAQRVSVIKQGIRLYSTTANLDDTYDFLDEIWNTANTKASVRSVVILTIQRLFHRNPGHRVWSLFRDCVTDFTKEDDYRLLDTWVELKLIPDEYTNDYVKIILDKMERLIAENIDYDKAWSVICKLIDNIDPIVAALISENMHCMIIENFLFDVKYKRLLAETVRNFTVNIFLLRAGNNLSSRLDFFTNFFTQSAKNYWNAPMDQKLTFYPFNYMAHSFVEYLTCQAFLKYIPSEILRTLLETYNTIIPPNRDPSSFLFFTYAIEIQRSASPKNFGERIGTLMPKLVDALCPELVVFMAEKLDRLSSSQTVFPDINSDEMKLSVIEGLIEVRNVYANIMAVKMLFYPTSNVHRERYDNVIQYLRKCKHPGVSSLLYEYFNTFNIDDIV